MKTDTEATPMTSVVEYSKTAAALAELSSKYKGTLFEVKTPQGLSAAKKARAELREYRVNLEHLRVEIKAPALKRTQLIDSEARRITAELVALEDPIDAQIKKEEERKEWERGASARAEAERIAAEELAKKQAEEAKLAAERAELARQRAELERAAAESKAKIEREELAARMVREEADRAARLKIESEERIARQARDAEETRIKAERDKVDAERRTLEENARAEQFRKDEEARAVRLAEQIKRETEENARANAEREVLLHKNELLDASTMLATFVKRFGHRKEFAPLVKWINQYLTQGRKAA